MTDHTGGPWQQKHDFDREGLLTIIGNVDGEYVDGVPHCTYTTICEVDDNPEGLSNARLIAKTLDFHAFATLVARLLLDGEALDGHAYEQSDEDAQDTLASLIVKARKLTGIEGPGKPVCDQFLDDGRGCCRSCGHFHGKAAEACPECDGLTYIGTGNDERACPSCQPKMAAEEARDRAEGF